MKRWKVYLAAGVFLTMTAMGASGCDKVVQATVLAETDASQAGETSRKAAEGKNAAEQVEAPEIYTADVRFDQVITLQTEADQAEDAAADFVNQTIHITADAPIEVPEVDNIRLKKISTVQFDVEMMESWAKILSAGEDAVQKEEHGGVLGRVTVEDVPYVYHYYLPEASNGQGENAGIQFSAWDWRIEWEKVVRTQYGIQNDENGKEILFEEKTAEECRKEADRLLKSLGLYMYRVSEITEEDEMFGWQLGAEDTADLVQTVVLKYEKMSDGIPVSVSSDVEYPMYEEAMEEDAAQSDLWAPEYLVVTYAGGLLESLYYTAPTEISDYSDENLFLLPFEEIRQIFENTVGEKMTGAGPESIGVPKNLEGVMTVWMQYPNIIFDNVEVTVQKVKLSYMRIREQVQGKEEGILIPVWDFCGTWKAGSTFEDGREAGMMTENENISLLTIDARDGTVLQRMVGY